MTSAHASVEERGPSSAPAGFVIVARDSANQEWGAAAVSRWIAVGARSIDARAGAGAWASLSLPDPRLGAGALERMAGGANARATLDSLFAGEARRAGRQLALVDRSGGVAAFTGREAPSWAGERTGPGYACQGLGLRDGEPVDAMARAFETTRGSLGDRMLAALDAAESLALLRGDVESAAIVVVRDGGGPGGASDRMTDLRIDEASDAMVELRRVYATHGATFLPAAYARLGDDARRKGDLISAEREYARAEMGFRAAVARAPKDPDALNELAWFLATHDRSLEEAVRFARAAVTARPGDPNLYDTLGEAEYRSGSLHRAIEAMQQAVRHAAGAPRYAERLKRWTKERSALEGSGKAAPDGAGVTR